MKNSWNLKLSSALILILQCSPLFLQAQFSKPEEKFPPTEEKYLYPILPGRPGSLAGTMGELRTTHFHSGIDIRTNNEVGFPVVASKSGYVSRISVSGSGYGNVMYITHPDGNTTLYAHLEKFLGSLGTYIRTEHYRRKTNYIDLYFREGQFTVRQGDTVAISGNTGSTGGPHLHFDIRDSNNFALDPLKVGAFPELSDLYPPAAEKVALRTLDIDSRINDQYGRFEFYVRRTGNTYALPYPIRAHGKIGIEVVAKDKLAAQSQFYGGVNYFEMRVDSQLVFKQAIESVNVDETRAIYTIMDYKTMRYKGSRFYKLYVSDGNDLNFYRGSPGTGVISVDPRKESVVEVLMGDSDNNTSTLTLRLQPTEPAHEVRSLERYDADELRMETDDNTLIISGKPCIPSANKLTVFVNGASTESAPAYYNGQHAVYLFDLRKVIPDSVVLCGKASVTGIHAIVPSGTEYTYYSDIADVYFPLKALYDTIYFGVKQTTAGGKEIMSMGSPDIPLHTNLSVSYKPVYTYARDPDVAVYRVSGRGYTYLGGEWRNNRINFATREFGTFVILRDSVGPSISPLSVNSYGVRFRVRDELSGIASIEARLNDEWLLMRYDAKTASVQSEQLAPGQTLKGTFVLTVTDQAGNATTYTRNIP
jgi:murein DD-endopeptidase MepM/ murein hydrolase activator NlpD